MLLTELPLVLFDCQFENVSWIYDQGTLVWSDLWSRYYRLIRSMIKVLLSRYSSLIRSTIKVLSYENIYDQSILVIADIADLWLMYYYLVISTIAIVLRDNTVCYIASSLHLSDSYLSCVQHLQKMWTKQAVQYVRMYIMCHLMMGHVHTSTHTRMQTHCTDMEAIGKNHEKCDSRNAAAITFGFRTSMLKAVLNDLTSVTMATGEF